MNRQDKLLGFGLAALLTVGTGCELDDQSIEAATEQGGQTTGVEATPRADAGEDTVSADAGEATVSADAGEDTTSADAGEATPAEPQNARVSGRSFCQQNPSGDNFIIGQLGGGSCAVMRVRQHAPTSGVMLRSNFETSPYDIAGVAVSTEGCSDRTVWKVPAVDFEPVRAATGSLSYGSTGRGNPMALSVGVTVETASGALFKFSGSDAHPRAECGVADDPSMPRSPTETPRLPSLSVHDCRVNNELSYVTADKEEGGCVVLRLSPTELSSGIRMDSEHRRAGVDFSGVASLPEERCGGAELAQLSDDDFSPVHGVGWVSFNASPVSPPTVRMNATIYLPGDEGVRLGGSLHTQYAPPVPACE